MLLPRPPGPTAKPRDPGGAGLVTARLDDAVVEALDRAVAAGVAANRGSLVANAVREWLERHGEEAIAASYQRRYGKPDTEHDALVAALSKFFGRGMPRARRALIQRGDVWDANIPGVGIHPVVVITRDTAIPVLSSLTCVPVTSSFHGHVAEVSVGQQQGLDHDSAANCDNISLPRQVLTRRRGRLDAAKLAELDAAVTISLGLYRQ